MKKISVTVFIIMFLTFFIFGFLSVPTYIHMGILADPGSLIPDLSRKVHNIFIQSNPMINSFYYGMLHKIPEWTMPIAILANGANMYYGFRNYKNKWWYYVILVLTIVMSFVLWDCFSILIHQDDMA